MNEELSHRQQYTSLAVFYDEQTNAVITVRRMYQGDGGVGIEVLVEQPQREIEVFQAKDLKHAC